MVRTSICLIKGDTITTTVDCGNRFPNGSRDDTASFLLSFGNQHDEEKSSYERVNVSLVMCDPETARNVVGSLTEVTEKLNEWLKELEKESV